MNVALSELPRFTSLPERGDHLTGGIIIAPSLGYMDRAYLSARGDGWAREPIVEMLIPSTLDDSLAPPGAHVASLFCQHFPYDVDGGWEARVDEAADHIIAHVDRYAPGFKASVVEGLYLCGSGAHPGGGVTGAPGHNAAQAILKDRRKWSRAA
jgi:phytoene dehydrogenase-like protein